MFRAIRKRLCENNGIPFIEEECPSPDKKCIGTCQACDYWLNRINNSLAIKRESGEDIDYSGIKEIYELYIMCERNRTKLGSNTEEEHRKIEPEDKILRGDVDEHFDYNHQEEHDLEEREEALKKLELLKHEMEERFTELRGRVMPPREEMGEIERLKHEMEEGFTEMGHVKPPKEEMGEIERENQIRHAVERLEMMKVISEKKCCPVCGEELSVDFRVCPTCGHTL